MQRRTRACCADPASRRRDARRPDGTRANVQPPSLRQRLFFEQRRHLRRLYRRFPAAAGTSRTHPGRAGGAATIAADDLIYVVSEGNDQIQRYRHDSSYAFVDVFAQLARLRSDRPRVRARRRGLRGELRHQQRGRARSADGRRSARLPSDSGLLGADNGLMVSAAASSSCRATTPAASRASTLQPPSRRRIRRVRHERPLRDARGTARRYLAGSGSPGAYQLTRNHPRLPSRVAAVAAPMPAGTGRAADR